MTKRVYEAAKEYGVSAKTVIKVLGDHNIKAGNFTGIDDKMKSILDTSFKKSKQNDKNIKMAEAKKGMEGTSRKSPSKCTTGRSQNEHNLQIVGKYTNNS